MKTKSLFILAALVLSMIVFSCEDSTTPDILSTDMSDYFPTTEGSWWIFNSYESDSSGNWHFTGRDSVYMGPSTFLEGRTAYPRVYNSWSDDMVAVTTTYFSLEGSKLYVSNKYSVTWELQIDLSKSELIIDSKEEHSDSTSYDETTGDSIRYKFDAYYSYKSIRLDDKDIFVKGNKIPSIGFDFVMSSEYTSQIGDKMETKSFKATSKVWFGKNVGIILVSCHIYYDV